jgi:hypothetical protein
MTARRKIPGTSMYYRETPMTRGAGLKRTGISRTTANKEKAKDDRRLKRIRAAWRKKHPRCFICGRRPTWEIHEAIGGSQYRHLTEWLPSFWVGVCGGLFGCHRAIQNDKDWPLARVMAHIAVWNPQEFDLIEVNSVLEPRYQITMSKVDEYLNQLNQE